MNKLHFIVDSREKLPYKFQGCNTSVATLDFGDYTIRGYSKLVRVERKELGDLVSSLRGKVPRLERQLMGLSRYSHTLVIVEGRLDEKIWWGHLDEWARASIIARLTAQYKIPICFAGNRIFAEHFTKKFLVHAKQIIDRRK